MIKSFTMPQPLMDELMALFLANGEDRRSQINVAVKHLRNIGLVTFYRVEEPGSPDKFYYMVKLASPAFQFLQLAFDLDIEMSWQPPVTDGLVATPPMPRPSPWAVRDRAFWELGATGRIDVDKQDSASPVPGSDGPDGA